MRTWVIIGALLIVVIIVVGAMAVTSSGEPVQAAKVVRGDIREFVDERGKTRLPETHLITMPFAGRIERIELGENSRVAKGQLVAEIVESDLQQAVDEARAVVERFEASIKENKDNSVEDTTKAQADAFVNSMEHTVLAAAKQLDSIRNRLSFAENFLTDTRELYRKMAKGQEDVDRALLDFENTKVEYSQTTMTVDAVKSIQAATNLLPTLINDYKNRKVLSRAVLEKQRNEAQARLDQVLTQLQRGRMGSPVDGIVLERVVISEQFLPAGTVLLKIGELERLEVEADVLSQDVVQIRENDEVEIYGPAVGAEVGSGLRGFVQRIYPAGFTKVSSLGVEQQRVKVIIHFADGVLDQVRSQHELGVDYRVRVRIFTRQKPAALVVPRSALFRGADGGWQSFVVRSGRARLQPVEVGLMNDQQAEVVKGLNQADVVVLAPESSLEEGDKVEPILRQ